MTITLELMLESLKLVLFFACITWVVSLIIDDVSIVDYIWSPLTLLVVAIYFYKIGLGNSVSVVMFLMVAVWAIRLTWFLVKRGRNQPENRRYQVIRQRNSPYFAYKSLYLIFIFQALLVWVISTLFVAIFVFSTNQLAPAMWSAWHSAGVLLWFFGLVYETVADRQLHHFNCKVVKQDLTLTTGLWRYCRHPNYFGEFCIWWGWFIYAIPTGSVWIWVAPLIMTFLLMKLSGVENMEQGIVSRRPDYQIYIDSTNAFFPGGPRRKVIEGYR